MEDRGEYDVVCGWPLTKKIVHSYETYRYSPLGNNDIHKKICYNHHDFICMKLTTSIRHWQNHHY